MPVIDLADVKWNLRVDGDDEDDQLIKLISRAASWVEGRTGVALERRDVEQTADAFADVMLRRWPVANNPAPAISYLDLAGDAQPFTGYRIRRDGVRSAIAAVIGSPWPRTFLGPGAITITYTAGFATPEDIPEPIRQALLVLIGGYYADREGGDVATAAEIAAGRVLDNANMRRRVV